MSKLERMDIGRELAIEPAVDGVNPDFSTAAEHPPANAEMGRRLGFAGIGFLIWAASVALIAIVPAVFLLPYLASIEVPIGDNARIMEVAKNDPTAIILQIAAIIPAHLLSIVLAWFVVSQGRRYGFLRTLGWGSGGFKWWHYIVILVGFLIVAAVVSSVMPEQEHELFRILKSSRTAVYVVAFVATLSAPFVEEVIYRGVLYSTFERAFGVAPAFALITLLFAIVHVPQYIPSYSTILLLTLLSLTLTAVRVYSNNLLPCVILHMLFNGVQSVLLVAEPWLKSLKPLEQIAAMLGPN